MRSELKLQSRNDHSRSNHMYIRTPDSPQNSFAQQMGEAVPNYQLQPPQLRMPQRQYPNIMPGRLTFPPLTTPTPPINLFPPRLASFAEITVTGYAPGATNLTPAQATQIEQYASSVAARLPDITRAVRFVSFRDPQETDVRVGSARASAARAHFERSLCKLNPQLTFGLKFHLNDCGTDQGGARVEVYSTSVMAAAPYSPCSVANDIGLPSLSCTFTPAAPQGRSLSQAFWQSFDNSINGVMRDLRVPESLRAHIRNAAHSAIEKGSEEILNQALSTTRLTAAEQRAISAAVRAAAQTPVR
jgi:hypothetical protein